jgi:GNAT superfamily N-acetyltransferase
MRVRFRLMTIEDIPEAMQLKDTVGWNQTSADWVRFLSANAEGCFVAESGGRVVGTSTSIVYEGRFAWIGMVIVDSQYRWQGIGTALLQRTVRCLDSRSVLCMKLDATPQGKPVYEKFGFVSECDIERWMLKRQHYKNIAEDTSAALGDVLPLDREIFGADRSTRRRERQRRTLLCGHLRRVGDFAFSGVDETVVTVHAPGQFTGDVNTLSGPPGTLSIARRHGRRGNRLD